MRSKDFKLLSAKAKIGLVKSTSTKISLGELLSEIMYPEITEGKFYIVYFNKVYLILSRPGQ